MAFWRGELLKVLARIKALESRVGDSTVTAASMAAAISAAGAKATPVDADAMPLVDSADSSKLKKVTWANIKATLKAYFDTLYQPIEATLTAIAGLTGAANKAIYFTGSDAAALYDLSASGRSLANLAGVADKGVYFSGTSTAALFDLTSAGRAIVDDANAAAQRTTLELGSAATDELTDWVAYTPTFTGFGTVSGVAIKSKRIGDTLRIRGRFTSGIATATEARMTLGFNGTNASVTSASTISTIELAGPVAKSTAVASAFYTLMEPSVGYITFSRQDGTNASLTKLNGDAVAATGQVFSLLADVPISGW